MASEKFGGGWMDGGGGRPNLVYSPGPSLCPLSLDLLDLTWDFRFDLGPDLDLTWDLDLDLSLTII